MRTKFIVAAAGMLVTLGAFSTSEFKTQAQVRSLDAAKYGSLPINATHCDPSIPIHIALIPQNQLEAGRTVGFRVQVESALDPDMVAKSWIDYELPGRLRRLPESYEPAPAISRSGSSRGELRLIVPDAARYEIRARLVVQLNSGQTISQTAVQWINGGGQDASERYLGRIVDRDGSGIRLYQGVTVRRHE